MLNVRRAESRDIPAILERRNRTDAGPTAPPQRLYMTNLWYPIPGLPYRSDGPSPSTYGGCL